LFEVRFSHGAEKFLRDCDGKLRVRFHELFRVLAQNPVPARDFDVCKIGGMDDTYRIRLSSHRTTYTVYWPEKVIRVLRIERRKDRSYKKL